MVHVDTITQHGEASLKAVKASCELNKDITEAVGKNKLWRRIHPIDKHRIDELWSTMDALGWAWVTVTWNDERPGRLYAVTIPDMPSSDGDAVSNPMDTKHTDSLSDAYMVKVSIEQSLISRTATELGMVPAEITATNIGSLRDDIHGSSTILWCCTRPNDNIAFEPRVQAWLMSLSSQSYTDAYWDPDYENRMLKLESHWSYADDDIIGGLIEFQGDAKRIGVDTLPLQKAMDKVMSNPAIMSSPADNAEIAADIHRLDSAAVNILSIMSTSHDGIDDTLQQFSHAMESFIKKLGKYGIVHTISDEINVRAALSAFNDVDNLNGDM
jgi:hypothetical protein